MDMCQRHAVVHGQHSRVRFRTSHKARSQTHMEAKTSSTRSCANWLCSSGGSSHKPTTLPFFAKAVFVVLVVKPYIGEIMRNVDS